ncbi:MAG: nucleotidyl transferase AbiEii/AbiGii toxin family protein [Acidobacteriia bacterium]|nr:nucleotidyl transferase AbiEii/AbiGii toxin family protein [Terriglobia bacterium]
MHKAWFPSLSSNDRQYALRVAAPRCGRRPYLLEKDIWVVQALSVLFSAPFANDLVFQGGTSLSKAYDIIRRLSEDIDITYDIRAFAPDFAADSEEPLPPTRSQEKRWTRAIRARLAEWTKEYALPAVQEGLARSRCAADVRADADRIYIGYTPLFDGYGFVKPEVKLEFGARSTGEPRKRRPVVCDASLHLPDLAFPAASPSVMLAERTFWEKATAMHVFCKRERGRGDRLSRHWHDLVRLADGGYAATALADPNHARTVARNKSVFFREKDAAGGWIDYRAAVTGGLQLVPTGTARGVLADDYGRMLRDGMLLGDGETFEDIMGRCADIDLRANSYEGNA